MSTADKLNKVLETKEAIKQAIIDKGQIVGDVFAEYPTAIQNIQSGGGTFVVPAGLRFGYTSLSSFPADWDWSEWDNQTNFTGAFSNAHLDNLPNLTLKNATNTSFMFESSKFLSLDLSEWNTSNVVNMSNMFANMWDVVSIKLGSTSKNQNFERMFATCMKLKSLPELDASSNIYQYEQWVSPIAECYSLRDFGGFKNINRSWAANTAYSLTYASLKNIITGLAAGVDNQILTLNQDQVNQLSDEDIEVAVNKGWTITPAKTIWEPIVVTNIYEIPSETYLITPKTYDFSQYTGSWGLPNQWNLYSFEGDVSASTSTENMFRDFYDCRYIKVSGTHNVTNMSSMFYSCQNATIDLSDFDTSNAVYLVEAFRYCTQLDSNLEFNLQNAENVFCMFFESNVENVVLNNVSKIWDFSMMFSRCFNLNSVTMTGAINPNASFGGMFDDIYTEGTFYYDSQYDYSQIISQLPSTWKAVPINK